MAKAQHRKQAEPEVVDVAGQDMMLAGVSEDQAIVTAAGVAVTKFMRGVAAFFTTAQGLEQSAKGTLAKARTLRPPTNYDEDEAIQKFIKQASSDKRVVEEHWKITSIISGFHRRMTAARSRATDALEESARIGNMLHNGYTEAEKRRAAAEQERLRREKEAEEQLRRDRELALAEAEAVKREESAPQLSEREQAFVELYTGGFPYGGNGQRSAERAGFKEPMKAAVRLLTLAKIQTAIKAKEEAAAIREQAAARKAMPLDVEVPEVKAEISTTYGFDRTTWSGEMLSPQLFVEAFMAGTHGIPQDLIVAYVAGKGETELNSYARKLHEKLNLWPGVRAKKRTGVV